MVFGEPRLAAAVTLALAGASIVASVLGLLLPWLLARTGSDPVYGSGPLATIVQDVLSKLVLGEGSSRLNQMAQGQPLESLRG